MQKEQEISALLRKAKLCELFKRKDKAQEVYELIIKTHPDDFRAYFNCAQLFVQQRDEKGLLKAFELFGHVLELDCSVIEAYDALAAICIKTHKPNEAVEFCKQGLKLQNTNKECLYNINVALRQLGRIEEAINLSWTAIASGIESVEPTNIYLSDPTVSNTIPQLSEQHPHQHQEELTIVCIKWGTKYNAQYVNNLYSALLRNIPEQRSFRLLCFTDDPTGIHPAVKCHTFRTETNAWQGWWMKAQIFAPSPVLTDWTLYIDLDTVIAGSLGFIYDLIEKSREECQISPNGKDFYVLRVDGIQNEARSVGMNSSLVLWNAALPVYSALYQYLAHHYAVVTAVVYKLDHYLEMMLYKHTAGSSCNSSSSSDSRSTPASNNNSSDTTVDAYDRQQLEEAQGVHLSVLSTILLDKDNIVTPRCGYFQDYCPGQVVDYFTAQRIFRDSGNACIRDDENNFPAVVCFPLQPKPHEVIERQAWVAAHWQ